MSVKTLGHYMSLGTDTTYFRLVKDDIEIRESLASYCFVSSVRSATKKGRLQVSLVYTP